MVKKIIFLKVYIEEEAAFESSPSVTEHIFLNTNLAYGFKFNFFSSKTSNV